MAGRSLGIRFAALGLALAFSPACVRAMPFGDLDAYANHEAFRKSDIASVLRLVTGDGLRVDTSSSRPVGSVHALYDGDLGSLAGEGGSLLAFDGPTASLTFDVPDWRRPDEVAFTAVEPIDRAGDARLSFSAPAAPDRELALSRTVLERRGRLALVEYATGSSLALPGGRLHLAYAVHGLSSARLGEFVVDGIGRRKAPPFPAVRVRTLEDWMAQRGAVVCPEIRAAYSKIADARSAEILRLLLGRLHEDFATKLVYWKSVPSAQGYTTHSLILRVDDTGHPQIDFVRAWLVVPDGHHGERLPLVVLPQQSDIYGALESLGVLGEHELGLAPELARHGVASLAFDSQPLGTPGSGYPVYWYRRYPDTGSTAKDLDNLRRLLDAVMEPGFQHHAGIALDPRRVGIWGFSYGAWISMVAAVMDDRIRAVAFSSFTYHDRDIGPGVTSVLFVPQLACIDDGGNAPLSVARILREYDRDALAVAPDAGLLEEWTKGLHDKRVTVVAEPYGHVVSESESAVVLDFFYRAFGMGEHAEVKGVKYDLLTRPSEAAPYVARENRWRELLVKAITGQ